MRILRNFSLKNYNSFGIDVKARKFISVNTVEELKEVLRKTYASELFILGGGSNMLLTQDLDKTVIHIGLTGKEIISETENEALVKCCAGENWHEFVKWTLNQGLGGLENLSLIPGNVGTAPVQNIGAYGVELKDCFVSCETLNIQTLEAKTFNLKDCEFGYRNSIFKNQLKNRYIITSVVFKLTKKEHQLRTDYGIIRDTLKEMGILKADIGTISEAVIKIRNSKLPDPKKLGNSGSFFKNPVVSKEKFENLQRQFPKTPFYEISNNQIKIPAGWLIDKAGLKGYRIGDAGVHKNQALVLVNYGNATGEEILNLARKIQNEIQVQFGIELEPEVNII